jgi:thioredoxin reductase
MRNLAIVGLGAAGLGAAGYGAYRLYKYLGKKKHKRKRK